MTWQRDECGRRPRRAWSIILDASRQNPVPVNIAAHAGCITNAWPLLYKHTMQCTVSTLLALLSSQLTNYAVCEQQPEWWLAPCNASLAAPPDTQPRQRHVPRSGAELRSPLTAAVVMEVLRSSLGFLPRTALVAGGRSYRCECMILQPIDVPHFRTSRHCQGLQRCTRRRRLLAPLPSDRRHISAAYIAVSLRLRPFNSPWWCVGMLMCCLQLWQPAASLKAAPRCSPAAPLPAQ